MEQTLLQTAEKLDYRRSGNSSGYILVKDLPDERRHFLEYSNARLLYGVMYRHGFAFDWEASVSMNFSYEAPDSCHYRKAINIADPSEMKAAVLLADNDMNMRLSVSKEEDTSEWKAKDREFRAWFHGILAEYGFRKQRNIFSATVFGGLTMIAREQKSTYSDVFYFNFEVKIAQENRERAGVSKSYYHCRWHEGSEYTLDWLLTPRDVFETSIRSYLDQTIVPVLSFGVEYLRDSAGFCSL